MSIRTWRAARREARYMRRRYDREYRGGAMVIESNGLPDGYEPPSTSLSVNHLKQLPEPEAS